MTLHQWLGVGSLVVVIAVIVFGFRQGFRVKPDKNRKVQDWPRITQGGTHG
jgi:hypothetical protein